MEDDVERMKYGKEWYERRNEMYFQAEVWSYVKERKMGECERRMPYSLLIRSIHFSHEGRNCHFFLNFPL